MASSGQPREVYRPSGKVRWHRFIPGLILTSSVALAMARCLQWVYTKGYYWVIAAPFFAALPPLGVWYFTLKWSHCRNRTVAAVTSVVLGLLLYLGYYEFGLVEEVGVQNAHRVGWLPDYVRHRMRTDVLRDVHRPVSPQARAQSNGAIGQVFNWFFFGCELVLVITVFLTMCERVTFKAYCEACRRWMKSETLALAPGSGAALWDALQSGTFPEVLGRLGIAPAGGQIQCKINVEHCSTCRAIDRAPLVYLTLIDIPDAAWRKSPGPLAGPRFSLINYPGVRTLINHAELRPQEIGMLAGWFPHLAKWSRTQPKLLAAARTGPQEVNRAVPPQPGERTTRVAQVNPVEPRRAGKLLTRRNAFMQTLIGVLSLLAGATIATVPMGVILALNARPGDLVFGIGLGWIAVWIAVAIFWVGFFQTYLPSRFMLGRTRRALKRRQELSVDPGRGDLFFVDIVPRANWGGRTKGKATDIGLLELNKASRELVFEGDCERYKIPAESILEIKTEFWTETNEHYMLPVIHYVVVVRAKLAEGAWEACFQPRDTHFRMRTAKRRLTDANELENKICELIGRRERPPNYN
jgi:hypothetical protein